MTMNGRNIHDITKGLAGILGGYKISPNTGSQEVESILLNAINMSFFERLNLAWKIVFPSPATRRISDGAKQKIVKNIVRTPSDFVEMESKDKVQLSVSTDSDLGTIYSVTVPVQRVKAEYQEVNGAGTITNIEYKDTGERSIGVKFDFYVPDE
ncbi:hypothetical protein Gotri_014775 [Gossypium trilobum]|uniref:Uncharacterized protein n=1 Tax=Gossypium trilobum TaxID=34281 RepID=A0A7J9DXV6_9ROSI|nr:hypothetical protein [Gossypium trilobum]